MGFNRLPYWFVDVGEAVDVLDLDLAGHSFRKENCPKSWVARRLSRNELKGGDRVLAITFERVAWFDCGKNDMGLRLIHKAVRDEVLIFIQ